MTTTVITFDHAEVSLLNITHIYVVPGYKDQTKPRNSNYGKSHIFSPAVKMRLVTSLRFAVFQATMYSVAIQYTVHM